MKSSSILLRWLPLVVWMGLIFFLSSLSGSNYPEQPTLSYFVERKGAHIIEYAVLMFLAARVVFALFPRETFKRVLLLAVVFSITFGVSDELHQFFVPYRGAKMSDVLIDGLGALMTMGAYFLYCSAKVQKN